VADESQPSFKTPPVKTSPVKTPPVTAESLRGFKQLQRVAGLLSRLHDAGCTRDKAGNRELHFGDE